MANTETTKMSPYLYAGLDEGFKEGYDFRLRYSMSGVDNAMALIADTVFSYLGIPFECQKSPIRTRSVVEARQISIYLILIKTGLSLNTVGLFFNRDHSTIIYSRDTVKNLMFADKRFKATVEKLHKMTLV